MGAQGLQRGARVRVRLGSIDLMSLDVGGTVTAQLQDPAAAPSPEQEEEELESAGPLQIAVDVDEPASGT